MICPRFWLRRWLVILFISSLISVLGFGQIAHSTDPAQLVQQGIEQYNKDNFKSAIELWQTALNAYDRDPVNRAIVLENLARAYQQNNQSSDSIQTWDRLIQLYQAPPNLPKLSQAMVEKAQLYSSIGQPKQAIALLCAPMDGKCTQGSAVQLTDQTKDQTTKAAALGSLGDASRLSGDYDSAIEQLNQTLALVKDNAPYRISALNGLANAYLSRARLSSRRAESARRRTQGLGETEVQSPQDEAQRLLTKAKDDETKAIENLNSSLILAQMTKDRQAQLKALLSLIPVSQAPQKTANVQQAIALLDQIRENRVRLYATIDLAQFSDQTESLLKSAIALSEKLGDDRAKSFALGELGAFYEKQERFEQALEMTRQAVLVADQKQAAKDSLYRWEAQTGRLLKRDPRNLGQAIAAYERAVQTLEEIRNDILSANTDLQFDFRKTVEPVYRELIELRLQLESGSQTKQQTESRKDQSKRNVGLVLTTMDSLRLAELQNYFGNECVLAALNRSSSNITTEANKSNAIQTILTRSTQDRKTAILNHILLDDQLILVLNLPNDQQHAVPVQIKRADLEQKIIQFRNQLQRTYEKQDFDRTLSQELYTLLVDPVRSYLNAANPTIETLVFVQDGLLRSIPMAALYDGKDYLIQNYAIATTPSLSLIDLTPFDRTALRALALGVTKEVQLTDTQRFYRKLSYADEELNYVVSELPGSKRFELLRSDLKTRLKEQPYPIIHIATHGQFGADPKDTFLVTGEGERLTIEEFERTLRDRTTPRDPIELLMLTACQTGTGDDRATLGLAGVAVQAGAKSALASLWSVNDKNTANLVKQFYANLRKPGLSKAKAMQEAQKTFVDATQNPGSWSVFILVGNWL